MILNDSQIDMMINGNILDTIAERHGVDAVQARSILSEMSFLEYMSLTENTVTPPSGQQVGSKSSGTGTTSTAPNNKMWANPNTPITAGMTVGVKDPKGQVMPMQVSQVDQNASGVKVRDMTTGKEEWYNKEQLVTMGMTTENDDNGVTGEDEAELTRILELAGISEMSSAGSSCAGAIATGPTAMGATRKRSQESVSLDNEHKRETPYKSIIGDTKPAQASGQLSANLAASGKPTARRGARK